MKLIVGLGNPGSKYEGTRHNLGFEVLEELRNRHGQPRPQRKFESELAEILVGSERCLLQAPLTYMNLSGQAVQPAAKFFKLAPEDVLVICDDLNLAPGQLRLRAAGSAGGQKGLGDIILRLGTDAVPRLRVGIGRPIPPQDAVSYVLGRIAGGERRVMDEAVLRAADAVECWATDGLETAMNRFNAGMS